MTELDDFVGTYVRIDEGELGLNLPDGVNPEIIHEARVDL